MKSFFLYIILVVLGLIALLTACSGDQTREVRIAATTDVHGAIFSVNPSDGLETRSSMSRIASFLEAESSENLLLLDNGDNLQGDPSVYYYNFVDTINTHIWARVLNYLNYDAVTVGNHDIEAGHSVYDRIRNEFDFPMLAANAVSTETGEPYFSPWVEIKRNGLKIIVFGLITPGIPGWLPEVLYEGIEFKDMTETARMWMPEILKEKPDLVIGLFHSGWDETYGGNTKGSYKNENASLAVAENVPGFDLIIIGHDHDRLARYIENVEGDSVLILDPGSRAGYIAVADVEVIGRKSKAKKSIQGEIISVSGLEPNTDFDGYFSEDFDRISEYVNRKIGTMGSTVSTRDAYFGDSEFIDLIHEVQLGVSGADISFAAPLSYDVAIDSGDLTVDDMFDLYRFENMLYTIEMSGEEIDRYLEFSYGSWLNEPDRLDESLFLTGEGNYGYGFINRPYNFDSASGIQYVVDAREPYGNKVEITSMSNGSVFDLSAIYRVAINSYRGNGGGGHIDYALKDSGEKTKDRLLSSTRLDLRYYMIEWIEETGIINAVSDENWKIIPEELVDKAYKTEMSKLFR
jgi:2',3'-cyclic-nucleotide 2'-phosphodiesterase/3'-nucleotidase